MPRWIPTNQWRRISKKKSVSQVIAERKSKRVKVVKKKKT